MTRRPRRVRAGVAATATLAALATAACAQGPLVAARAPGTASGPASSAPGSSVPVPTPLLPSSGAPGSTGDPTTGSASPTGGTSTDNPAPAPVPGDTGGSRAGPPVLATLPARQAPTAGLQRFYSQRLTWRACGTTVRCADLTVPLDYGDLARGTITIALNRQPATGPGPALGDLVVNPGGPGGSGLQYALAAPQVLTPGVRARYAVVGFDPRGVGQSTPVSCLDTAGLDAFVDADPTPSTAAEVAQVAAAGRSMADGCARQSARILPYLGTVQTDRDLDVLRAALDQPRLTYLGKSYGTYIGSTYADQFPARVGRFVLDGAVDPSLDSDALDLGQARGFQTALTAFLTDWISDGTCPLGSTPAAAQARLQALLAPLEAHPLALDGPRPLTLGEAVNGVLYPLYSRQSWSTLRVALTTFAHGDGTGLQLISDADTGRGPNGYQDNGIAAFWATSCLDRPATDSDARIRSQVPAFQQASPVFGLALAWGSLPCRYWHVPSTSTAHQVHAPGTPPILVVGTTRDPATPYAWAQSLAAQLDSGVFLGRVGDGHTGYDEGNSCVDTRVDTYLLTGRAPDDGTVCPDPAGTEAPGPAGSGAPSPAGSEAPGPAASAAAVALTSG